MISLKILLIDDHKILAQGLAISLSKFDSVEKIDVVDSEFTIDGILDKIKLEHYDIILMDLNIKKICQTDGIDLSIHILDIIPNIKILGLTGYDYPYFERECYRVGMSGFANKEIDTSELYSIIIKILKGNLHFSENKIIDDENLTSREIRSEEHTSELQSRQYLVCRLLLEKKKKKQHKKRQ